MASKLGDETRLMTMKGGTVLDSVKMLACMLGQGWLGHSKNGQTRKCVWSSCNACNQLLMGANY